LARLFADACDVVADIIFGMKTKAEAELAVMAVSVGLSIGAACFTGGLSAVLGAAEVTAMRQLVKRIMDEAADQIVNELIAKVTEPVNAKLEAMVEDTVLNLADDAFSLPSYPAGGGAHVGGADGGGRGQRVPAGELRNRRRRHRSGLRPGEEPLPVHLGRCVGWAVPGLTQAC
jgi:hypothetical protein